MRRIVMLLGVLLLIILGFVIYSLISKKTIQNKTLSPARNLTPSLSKQNKPLEQRLDWVSFNSTTSGFSIKFPRRIKHELGAGEDIFTMFGPLQKAEEEVQDGAKLIFRSGDLKGIPFKTFVDRKYKEILNNPSKPILGGKVPITLAGVQGIAFTIETVEKKTEIFLPKGDGGYIEIITHIVDPNKKEQNYQKIVEDMLTTLKLTN